MKNLEVLGVREMDASELKSENGGFVGAIVAAIIIAGVVYAAAQFVNDVIINKEPYDPTE